jgi:hypothetical protein
MRSSQQYGEQGFECKAQYHGREAEANFGDGFRGNQAEG